MADRNNIEDLVFVIAHNNMYEGNDVEEACAELYNRIKSRVLHQVQTEYCKGHQELAEDAFQSSMVKLFVTIRKGNLQNVLGIYKWVKTACRFYILDWNRIGSKTEEYTDDTRSGNSAGNAAGGPGIREVCFTDLDRDGDGLMFADSISDHHYYFDPRKAYAATETAHEAETIISSAIANKSQRKVIHMFVIEGMKQEEIAASLGMNLNTVKSNLLYARRAIRQWQEKTGFDPHDYLV